MGTPQGWDEFDSLAPHSDPHGTGDFAVLEGLESSYESPGIGTYWVWFEKLPEIGKRFVTFRPDGRTAIVTGTVRGIRKLCDISWGFRTARSTYRLVLRRGE